MSLHDLLMSGPENVIPVNITTTMLFCCSTEISTAIWGIILRVLQIIWVPGYRKPGVVRLGLIISTMLISRTFRRTIALGFPDLIPWHYVLIIITFCYDWHTWQKSIVKISMMVIETLVQAST